MEYDVIVIGGATSGAYFAAKTAKTGHKVLIIEKLSAEKTGTRMDIFHVSKTDLATFDMPAAKQGDDAWAFEFNDNHFSSPSNRYRVYSRVETVGLHMHEYVSLMLEKAKNAGAEIAYSTEFKEFIITDGVIKGVRCETADGTKEYYAKTVVDCSGSAAAGRTALPSWYGIETFSLAADEMFYVILRYAQFEKPQINTFFLNTKSWLAPFSPDDKQKILGTGAVNSFENVEKEFVKLDAVASPDPFTVIKTEKGTTPYRRPPYSLVADNFIVTGDAACLTKPDCGEGVTSSMVMMDIAAETLSRALKNGDTSKKALWEINRTYNRVQGADFCLVRAFLTKVIKASDAEIEYLFSKKIIFNEKFLNGGKISAKDVLDVVAAVTKATVKKNLSAQTVAGVIKGASLGLALRAHYMNFPENPDDFNKWVCKADKLWEKVGKVE